MSTITDEEHIAFGDVRDENGEWVPRGENGNGPVEESAASDGTETALAVEIDTIEAFSAVDEPGAAPLVGDADNVLIPENGDVMVYGDGGAGKTTLMVDAACHLAAGEDWLGLPVPRPLHVLLIEVEGPRPLFRAKLRRKLGAWEGEPIAGRVLILRSPWAKFSFASEEWRSALARAVEEENIDIIIAGPLTRIGMDEAGTIQQVRDFMGLVSDLRGRSAHRVAVTLIHHENRAGTVSGAWEGAGDTLLHVREAGHGHTVVYVQKARWSSEHHGTTIKLQWAPGESYEIEDERDLFADVTQLLADRGWRTIDEIRTGVGVGTASIRELIDEHPDGFVMRTGEAAVALGRNSTAKLYQLVSWVD